MVSARLDSAQAECTRFARDERGAVALLFALAVLPALTAVAAGLEYSRAAAVKTELQKAIDSAVLAGVSAPAGDRDATARRTFDGAKPQKAGVTASASFLVDAQGRYVGNATAQVATATGRVLGVASTPVTAQAAAGLAPPAAQNGLCILVLDPNGAQALLVNSGASIKAPNCEIHVKSNRDPASIVNAGATLDVAKLCSKGRILFNTATRPPYQENCNGHHDPYTGKLPKPAQNQPCTISNKSNFPNAPQRVGSTSGVTVWCGWNNINFAQPITFEPGLHIVRDGAITIAAGASVIAKDVTFYFEDESRIQLNGDAALTLEAPTSGTYAGIAMFEKQGLKESPFVFNGLKGQSLQGIFYLPSREVTFNSASSAQGDRISLVVNRLIVNSTTWNFQNAPGGQAIAGAQQQQPVLVR